MRFIFDSGDIMVVDDALATKSSELVKSALEAGATEIVVPFASRTFVGVVDLWRGGSCSDDETDRARVRAGRASLARRSAAARRAVHDEHGGD